MASKLSRFLSELKRRKVYQVAATYAGIGLAIAFVVTLVLGGIYCTWIGSAYYVLLIGPLCAGIIIPLRRRTLELRRLMADLA